MLPNSTGTFSLLTTEFIAAEVLPLLTVNSLLRLRWVSKFWNTLISPLITDPTFVKLHFQRSPRNKHIALTDYTNAGLGFVTFPLNHLIENPSITIPNNPYVQLEINDCTSIIGSCNGLLCLLGLSLRSEPKSIWFRIWNPATKTISQRLGSRSAKHTRLRCTFVYDNSTTTYKVVHLFPTEVKILNLGDNSWRTISSFPSFENVNIGLGRSLRNDGVYLNGTVNWFAIRSNLEYYQCRNNITVDQFLIISLDLGTETYMQLSPPPCGIDEVPIVVPTIAVLMDCLCFSHNLKKTHFVIWQMTEFGVEQSWTQFLKISFQNLQLDRFVDWKFYLSTFYPICLSEDGHTLILGNSRENLQILYNLRDNRAEQTSDTNTIWFSPKSYVESLASIC